MQQGFCPFNESSRPVSNSRSLQSRACPQRARTTNRPFFLLLSDQTRTRDPPLVRLQRWPVTFFKFVTFMNDLNSLLEHAVEDTSPKPSKKNENSISKSERIRLYMKQHPGIRNKDIVSALSHHGVKAADVANVKSQMKRKAAKKGKSKSPVKTKSAPATPIAATSAESPAGLDATIGLGVIEAGIAFVENAGGIAEAQHVLNVIKRIRSI